MNFGLSVDSADGVQSTRAVLRGIQNSILNTTPQQPNFLGLPSLCNPVRLTGR